MSAKPDDRIWKFFRELRDEHGEPVGADEMSEKLAALKQELGLDDEFKDPRYDVLMGREPTMKAQVDELRGRVEKLEGYRMALEEAGIVIDGDRRGLELRSADFSGSSFDDVNLSGSRFEDVKLSGAVYRNVDMSECAFDNLAMRGGCVRDANLSDLSIEQANLTRARLVNCDLSGMTIDSIAVTEMLDYWRAGHAAPSEAEAK